MVYTVLVGMQSGTTLRIGRIAVQFLVKLTIHLYITQKFYKMSGEKEMYLPFNVDTEMFALKALAQQLKKKKKY